MKICVQSQLKVVLVCHHRFWQIAIKRGRQTKLTKIITFYYLSKFVQTFTIWLLKVFSFLPIHINTWGNFPFKEEKQKEEGQVQEQEKEDKEEIARGEGGK